MDTHLPGLIISVSPRDRTVVGMVERCSESGFEEDRCWRVISGSDEALNCQCIQEAYLVDERLVKDCNSAPHFLGKMCPRLRAKLSKFVSS